MEKKLLIIDDDQQDLKFMQRRLAELGFDEILLAEKGEDGLKIVDESKPDIVVTDTQLPGMNGFEICEAIKAKTGKDIKVIIVTGLVDILDASKARQAGADDYCVKTADYSALIEATKKLVENE